MTTQGMARSDYPVLPQTGADRTYYSAEATFTMSHEPNAALFEDPTEATLERLAEIVREECDALGLTIPAAASAQWTPSPIPKPRDDTAERAKGGHGDPTPDVVLDGRRLALRAQVLRSETVLRDALVAVRGVRVGLERALSRWEGE